MHYQSERNFGCRVSDAWTYRGLKTVILENELLRVAILADKGADVYQLVHKPSDTDFMWRTPWGVRDPRRFMPTTGWPPGQWLDVYEGGWQTLAPTAGPPTDYRGAEIGQHSEATLMPWDAQIIEDSPERAAVRFWVRTYRTPFYIEKTLSVTAGSPVLTVEETVVNEAEEEAECVWGQHIALGAPFLGPACRLDVPGATVFNMGEGTDQERRLAQGESGQWPHTPGAGGGTVDLRTFPKRSDRLMDLAMLYDLAGGWYAVTNTELGLGFGFSFPQETFRFIWYWQVFGGGTGYPWYRRTYNVGLEPFSSLPGGMPLPGSDERTALVMGPGERRTATMRAVAFESKTGVTAITPEGQVTTAK